MERSGIIWRHVKTVSLRSKRDSLASHKTPSPLMGEGWGEGEYNVILRTYVPLPLFPSHEGRGI